MARQNTLHAKCLLNRLNFQSHYYMKKDIDEMANSTKLDFGQKQFKYFFKIL